MFFLVSCSRDIATGRRCSSGSVPCASGDAGRGAADGFGNSHGGAGSDGSRVAESTLSVAIEDIDRVSIEIVTLGCAGDCADVEAVASGGHLPYRFAWEDGSTAAARRVCSDASTRFWVTATDSAIMTGEFKYEAQTATATLSAQVLACSDDAGPRDAGPLDAGPLDRGSICLDNPSLEGTPGICEVSGGLTAAPWVPCAPGCGDIWDEQQGRNGRVPGGPVASDGATYLELFTALGLAESVAQPLCAPLLANHQYSFEIDLAYRPDESIAGTSAGVLQVWGGKTQCGADQLLWTSPQVSSDWTTHCVTFAPVQDLAFIQLKALLEANATGVFVDHLVPVSGCGS